jgi:hypothetical protein
MDETKKAPVDTPVVEFAPGDEDEEKAVATDSQAGEKSSSKLAI